MVKTYNTIVYILRGQPIHDAHKEIIVRASKLADSVVVILGSAFLPRTYKNPFSAEERYDMISKAVVPFVDKSCEIHVEFLRDVTYNDQAWAKNLQEIVNSHTKLSDKIALMGHKKDESSYYLNMFPQWEFVSVELINPLHATDIRDIYFRRTVNMTFLLSVVPTEILSVVPTEIYVFLTKFKETKEYEQIIREREFILEYKKQFDSMPYPPIFVTSDAVVFCLGHVLLIKRRSEPGKGLWAFPGGFLNATLDKSILDSMVRELREETGIKVPVPVIKGSITNSRVFDNINRSTRGRTITHAFKIVLSDATLPKIRGGDDAEKARWIPVASVKSEELFEDHYDILQWGINSD